MTKGPDGKGMWPTVTMDFLLWICANCNVKSSGTLWQYFRQLKQLHAHTVHAEMTRYDTKEVANICRTMALFCMAGRLTTLSLLQDRLGPRFRLRSPNSIVKQVADSGDLLAILIFNIAYDNGIFTQERHQIQMSGLYLLLAYTGCRAGELVDNEKPTDGLYHELFPSRGRAGRGAAVVGGPEPGRRRQPA